MVAPVVVMALANTVVTDRLALALPAVRRSVYAFCCESLTSAKTPTAGK